MILGSFYLILLILLINFAGFSQSFNFNFSFGKFRDASSFYISSAGFIYVTDTGSDEVYKLDTLGNLKKEIGGHGWDEESFDDPADVFATPLNVYVSDKNNHRIQRFDKDLNFISQLRSDENTPLNEQFGYPLGCVTSTQGDMFILDSENKRIIKFDLFGNFIQNFGGYEAGAYTLNSPRKIAISPNNNIFVLDGNTIKIFDQFGNGMGSAEAGIDLNSLTIIFSSLTVNSRHEILSADLRNPELKFNKVMLQDSSPGSRGSPEILSTLIFNNKLYLLTSKEILVYTK
ncbi:MAG TPA: NHL repeat-containing protein [Ignavibacteriaceae bacterium]|nr:NHL repeat-containing protein [Ignavibacteriaceae bacterium]